MREEETIEYRRLKQVLEDHLAPWKLNPMGRFPKVYSSGITKDDQGFLIVISAESPPSWLPTRMYGARVRWEKGSPVVLQGSRRVTLPAMADLRPSCPTPAVRFGVDAIEPPFSGMQTRVVVEQKMFWGWVGVGALGVLGIAALTLANQPKEGQSHGGR